MGIVSNKDRIHPTQKSVEHLMRFIYLHTNKGDTILDPFGGSMTTGIAAYNTGRKFVGTEIDRSYYDAAVKRFNEYASQKRLEI